mmetsp:Transcript_19782/g.34136  ORF Transcript_19782/g.34136 Transcript_19782/m.34136 type:complete len:215 (+) Transcript_19782:112-756(+)|eukprot:CAMPEP_0119106426 /NCGR_PEP_ID=MMETSP1180-20130426/4263_1 /TAXON_ID=3052 ORGANISM="Chlamydomonas cf sp, Strain CCMP681" /NCGR_SAMPLE_ID=MMETSP1180 /ASSEMBLY_ACC=CAM_ASM_000741 /LENGTH=214 /DNA_ID=CAMNT_0007091757 /DNA_START=66 /DNA_END=710 /DNA_ORIENTATION=+
MLAKKMSQSVACSRKTCGQVRPIIHRQPVVIRAQMDSKSVAPVVALSAAICTLASSGSALAATELVQIAVGDNRPTIIAGLLVPVVGWVAFNIISGALNQLDTMGEKARETTPDKRSLRLKRRAVLGPALGLGAASLLTTVASSEAATELAQLAASDSRPLILASLFVPVIGWVGFNIVLGALAQFNTMKDRAEDTPAESRSAKIQRAKANKKK